MRKLLLIVVVTLVCRLALAGLVRHPGIADPNHYYNLAVRIVEGHGFTADYIWQYNVPPPTMEQAETHWMPMTSFLAAGSMRLLGVSVRAALLPFVLLSSLVPVLGYAAARQMDLSEESSLFSAAAVAAFPEMTLYALRTDTVVPAALFTGASILLLNRGLTKGAALPLVGSGLAAGAAFLTRTDAILLLPVLAVTLVVRAASRTCQRHSLLSAAVIVPLLALVVAAPWLARNMRVAGSLASPQIGDMFFYTDFLDHFAYGRSSTLETMLGAQSVSEAISKRVWELAAAFKVMILALDGFFSVAVAGGLLVLWATRDRDRWLNLAPALVLLLGLLVAYPVLIPFASQGGSFKRAFMTLLPLLVPMGAYALERAVSDVRLRRGAMILVVALAAAHTVDEARLERQFVRVYAGEIERMAESARVLPDTNGDGEIILMAQDPFMLRFVGLRSVMFPDEDRDTILLVARRYGVDYLLMPADRASLDPLLTGDVVDRRFTPVEEVPGTQFSFYGIED